MSKRESANRTERSIRREEDKLEGLELAQLIESLTEGDISDNSLIAKRLLNFPDSDPHWRAFAMALGGWEIGIGEVMKALQQEINTSLELLQVMTGAQDKIQLLQFAKRLKKLEKRLPSIIQQVAAGMIGGQIGQSSNMASYPQIPGVPNVPSTPSEPTGDAFISYPWTDAAKATNGPAPLVLGGVVLMGGKAQIADVTENAIGVAVSVDSVGKMVEVATNGDRLQGLAVADLAGLVAGDELVASKTGIGGRHLITLSEAASIGIAPGTMIKVIARVLQNDGNNRIITILDRDMKPMPVVTA